MLYIHDSGYRLQRNWFIKNLCKRKRCQKTPTWIMDCFIALMTTPPSSQLFCHNIVLCPLFWAVDPIKHIFQSFHYVLRIILESSIFFIADEGLCKTHNLSLLQPINESAGNGFLYPLRICIMNFRLKAILRFVSKFP